MKNQMKAYIKGLTLELKYAILKIKEGSTLQHWRIRKKEIENELKRRKKNAKRSKKRK